MAQTFVYNDDEQKAREAREQYSISAYNRADGVLKFANNKGYVCQDEIRAGVYALHAGAEVGDVVQLGRTLYKVLGKNDETITMDAGKTRPYRDTTEYTMRWRLAGEPKARQPKAPKAPKAEPIAEPIAEPVVAEPITLYDTLKRVVDEQTAELVKRAEVAEEKARDMAKECLRMKAEIERQRKVIAELEEAGLTGVRFVPSSPKEVEHPQFRVVLTACQKRQPVYLYGPAGTGKTTLAKAIARALGLKCYTTGAVVDKSELTGYVKPSDGLLVLTALYLAMKYGGVFLFDEIDCSYPEAIVAFNEVLANKSYTFPNGEVVEAHPDFILIAGANTIGEGATAAYNASFKMAASTKDRFVFIPVDYVPEVDLANADGDAGLVEFFNAVRAILNADRNNNTYVASPRGIRRVKDLECLGKADALGFGLFNAMNREDAKRIISNLQGSGEWFDAAHEYASQL